MMRPLAGPAPLSARASSRGHKAESLASAQGESTNKLVCKRASERASQQLTVRSSSARALQFVSPSTPPVGNRLAGSWTAPAAAVPGWQPEVAKCRPSRTRGGAQSMGGQPLRRSRPRVGRRYETTRAALLVGANLIDRKRVASIANCCASSAAVATIRAQPTSGRWAHFEWD